MISLLAWIKQKSKEFKRWVIAAIGTIAVGLTAAWVQFYAGPSSSVADEDLYQVDIMGVEAECNIEIIRVISMEGQERLKNPVVFPPESTIRFMAFFAVGGMLEHAVFSNGDRGTYYECNFPVEGYHWGIMLDGAQVTGDDGSTCQWTKYRATYSEQDEDEMISIDGSRMISRRDYHCLDGYGKWKKVRSEERSVSPRFSTP